MSSRPEPGTVPDFETWFRTSAGQILRWAYFYTRNPELAEDIAQDTVVKVYKAWTSEEKRNKILTQPAYVRKIVKNCFLDYAKGPLPDQRARSRTRRRAARLARQQDRS
jgi:DNA-directed RNA polymerase specialized sigma24 family protein